MPSIINLKFKGNKSFVPFSNLGDADSLTMTWKVCTKVASFLEQGQRLENLSWRLWHLQNLMVDTDNAKSKREFKKLSKCMSDKLDKEKGRSIEELQAPGFRRNHSTDLIQQRAIEREKEREANNSGRPGIHRMQFTFSIEAPNELIGPAAHPVPTQKPDLKPSVEFKDNAGRRGRPSARAHAASAVPSTSNNDASFTSGASTSATAVSESEHDKPLTQRGRRVISTSLANLGIESDGFGGASLRFPSLFSSDFGPAALLYPTPTLTNVMTYGEGLNTSASLQAVAADGFSIPRPTFELGLDELLHPDSPSGWEDHDIEMKQEMELERESEEDFEQEPDDSGYSTSSGPEQPLQHQRPHGHNQRASMEDDHPRGMRRAGLLGQAEDIVPRTITPSRLGPSAPTSSITSGSKRPALSVRTARAGPSATPVSNGANVPIHHSGGGGNNSAPGGVKAECSNCGATHTPLWRRGLNDELNCNACGLYCKLHKRPRPKSMRNSHGEGRAQTAPRQESQEVVGAYRLGRRRTVYDLTTDAYTAQCYNCHTTATPLWRKDDEGKTVCNACGLYYKLHGSPRPISMKSDVIRKRARHDARRSGGAVSETPSASPGASRRASPIADGTMQNHSADAQVQGQSQGSNIYDEQDYAQSQSQELMNALGSQADYSQYFQLSTNFPGPYHPDLITQLPNTTTDTLVFPHGADEYDSGDGLGRVAKRRRLSSDSASEPPSSATSYTSYADSFASGSPAPSSQSSLEYPFSYGTYGLFSSRAPQQSYWHPPMLPPNVNEGYVHPPMLPPGVEDGGGHMDFLHGSGMHHDEADALFATYLHPPMVPPEDSPKVAMGSLQPHPPMIPQEWSGAYEYHDNGMQAY